MKQLILVDSVQIGVFLFLGYIIEGPNKECGFAIYISDADRPVLWMLKDTDGNKVTIHLDEDIIAHIATKSKSDFTQRKQNFKKILDFIVSSEKKAAYMVFKGMEMEYFSDTKLLAKAKSKYIHTAPKSTLS
ncbi:hypothetical protein ACL9RF_02060 [Sphingobacterium sp. Mn56C]|uniref:hypothetical protein n=1 Tax=Sphingobacterium sp. Mn56C TaxID=3395261 RepID=UPI003BECB84A